MAIDLAEVGATPGTNAENVLQISFGLYLPGITFRDGFDVVVRIIHDADRFNPDIQPVDVHLDWVDGSEFDLWRTTVPLPLLPGTSFGQDGVYIYRFQLWRTPFGGPRQLVTNWFTDPFARETDVGLLSAVTSTRPPAAAFQWNDAAWQTPAIDDFLSMSCR